MRLLDSIDVNIEDDSTDPYELKKIESYFIDPTFLGDDSLNQHPRIQFSASLVEDRKHEVPLVTILENKRERSE